MGRPYVCGPAARAGSAREGTAFEDAGENGCVGREDPRAPGDDLDRTACALQVGDVAVVGSFYLQALRPHDAAAREAPAVREGQDLAASHDGLEGLPGAEGGPAVEPEGAAHGAYAAGVESAPDHCLARIGGEPAHPHVLGPQPVPDRKEKPGDEPEARFGMGRQRGDLLLPEDAPFGLVRLAPVRGLEFGPRHALPGGGPLEAHPLLHAPVVEQHRGRGQEGGRPFRAGVDDERRRAGLPGHIECGIGRHGHEPVASEDLDEAGRRAGIGVGVEGLAAGGSERVRSQGLDADLIRPRLDGLFDVGLDARFEFCEQRVLLLYGKRQQAVQELRHGREVFLERSLIRKLESGRLLEARERPAGDPAPPERSIELAERRPCVGALEVVPRAEERRLAVHCGLRVPLAPGDGAQGIEPPRDGGDEAPLSFHVGGHGPEQGRRGLVRPVGTPQALDRLIRPPAGFQQVVDPSLRVDGSQVGVVAAPGAPRHGKDEDALLTFHEGRRLGEAYGCRTRAEREPHALRVLDAEHPPGAAGDLGHGVVAEAVHDLVQRRGHRREGGQLPDQRLALGEGLLGEHGIPVFIDGGPAHEVPLLVGEGLLQLDREGVRQEIEHVFPGRQVDRKVVPFGRRDLRDPSLHQGLSRRDELDHGRAAGIEVGLDRADERGTLHGAQEVAEEPLLRALEGGERGPTSRSCSASPLPA